MVPMADRASTIARLRAVLSRTADPGGGWPYYAGKASRVEATAWALLALADSDDAPDPASTVPHLSWLASRQRADGLLVDGNGMLPNFTANGTAACALERLAPAGNGKTLSGLLAGIVSVKGVSVNVRDAHQDSTLQGWPWIPDTFSWVVPTAWCSLALKKAGPQPGRGTDARVAEADKLLLNRACDGGGWNYGNASILGQDLRPYVPTSAIALLALQDRPGDPMVRRSVAYLSGAAASERSAMALAMASLCLRAYGRPAEEIDSVDDRLAADLDRAERVGNLMALAMALYALSADRHLVQALRLTGTAS